MSEQLGAVSFTKSGLPIIDLAGVDLDKSKLPLIQACGQYMTEHYMVNCARQDPKRPLQTFWKAMQILGPFREIETMGRAESRLYTSVRSADVLPATIRRELTFLRAVAGHAKREERIKNEISFQMPPASEARVRWLTRDEHRRLMQTPMPGRLYRFYLLAFGTGARSRAIEELTWERVDLKRRAIDYRVPNVRYKNKRRIVVPISDDLMPRIERMYERRKDDFVIGLGRSGRATSCYHAAERAMNLAGIADAVPRHVCRHTFASWLLQAGVSIYEVAKLMGDTVMQVERTYGHLAQDTLLAAINKLH